MGIVKSDYLIIGSGIIGLALSKNLREKYPDKSIVIIDKEKDVAYHSSGRNSGVLHAGFYYTKDSLKAKFGTVNLSVSYLLFNYLIFIYNPPIKLLTKRWEGKMEYFKDPETGSG